MVEKKNYATTQYPEKTDKKLKNARKWAIRGGVFNCIAAFPFALPFVFDNYINLFNDINSFLGFGGKLWISPSEGANNSPSYYLIIIIVLFYPIYCNIYPLLSRLYYFFYST